MVLRKIVPVPCVHGVFVLKNLVRPNLYTDKPLKRNDRKSIKKSRINERQIRIRNSLPPLSNPHQKTKTMKPATFVKTAIRALFAVPCALFLWVIYFAVGVVESLVCSVLQTIWCIVLFGIFLVCVI